MVVYRLEWAGTWFTVTGPVEFQGEAFDHSLRRLTAKMEDAGLLVSPPAAHLRWEEPLLELLYRVSRVEDNQGFFGLDLEREAREAGVELPRDRTGDHDQQKGG